MNVLLSQVSVWTPSTLSGLRNEIFHSLPVCFLVDPQPGVAFLTQNIEPMPCFQLPKDQNRAKFAVADHKNRGSLGQQSLHILEQAHLLLACTVSTNILDPTPGNGHRSTAVGQADHQELMTKANFRSIHDQANIADPLAL